MLALGEAAAAGCETGASGSWPGRGGDLSNTNWEWERQVGGQSQDYLFTPPRGYMSGACVRTCSALAPAQP